MNGLDLTCLNRFYPVSIIISACAALVVARMAGTDLAIGTAVGGLFGIINLLIIIILTRSTLDPVRRNPYLAAFTLTIKIPVIYGVLIYLFAGGSVDILGFAIGFQLFLTSLLIFLAVTSLLTARHIGNQGGNLK